MTYFIIYPKFPWSFFSIFKFSRSINAHDTENTLMDSPNSNPLKRPLPNPESTYPLAGEQEGSSTHPDTEPPAIDFKKSKRPRENRKNRSKTRQRNPKRMTLRSTLMHPQLYLQRFVTEHQRKYIEKQYRLNFSNFVLLLSLVYTSAPNGSRNRSQTVRKPNGWDCEPALHCSPHLRMVRIPFAANWNVSVFCGNTKRTGCAGCPLHAPDGFCSPQVCGKLINHSSLTHYTRMAQRVSGALVYTKLRNCQRPSSPEK